MSEYAKGGVIAAGKVNGYVRVELPEEAADGMPFSAHGTRFVIVEPDGRETPIPGVARAAIRLDANSAVKLELEILRVTLTPKIQCLLATVKATPPEEREAIVPLRRRADGAMVVDGGQDGE